MALKQPYEQAPEEGGTEPSLKRSRRVGEEELRQNFSQNRTDLAAYGMNESESSDESSSVDNPDLALYFSQWEIPPKDAILLCRTYANYLTRCAVVFTPLPKGQN